MIGVVALKAAAVVTTVVAVAGAVPVMATLGVTAAVVVTGVVVVRGVVVVANVLVGCKTGVVAAGMKARLLLQAAKTMGTKNSNMAKEYDFVSITVPYPLNAFSAVPPRWRA